MMVGKEGMEMLGIIEGVVGITMGALALLFLGGVCIYWKTIRVTKKNKCIKCQQEGDSFTTQEERRWFNEMAQSVQINAEDGLRLQGYLFKQSSDVDVKKLWVILVHGYRRDAISAISPQFFLNRGYNVLAVDLRGHGKSEGKYVGMGWQDRKDLLEWIDYLIQEEPKAKIVLYGISMGATTVMMAAGESLPFQVKAMIEDSGYTTAWDLLAYSMKQTWHLPSFPLLNICDGMMQRKQGYSLKEASAVKQLKKCKVPSLFIHGNKDKCVPFYMLNVLYEATHCKKEKLIIERAGHAMGYRVQSEKYWRKVFKFIEKYVV